MQERVHICVAGDTLVRLAAEYLRSANRWREIQHYNHLPEGRPLRIGQVLRIPLGAHVHVHGHGPHAGPDAHKKDGPRAPHPQGHAPEEGHGSDDDDGPPAPKARPQPPAHPVPTPLARVPLQKQEVHARPHSGEELKRLLEAGKLVGTTTGTLCFAGVDRYLEIAGRLTKMDRGALKALAETKRGIAKPKDFMEALASAFDFFIAMEQEKPMLMMGHGLITVGAFYSLRKRPEAMHRALGHSKSAKHLLKEAWEYIEEIEAVFDVSRMVGAGFLVAEPRMLNEAIKKFDEGAKTLLQKLVTHPKAAAHLLPPLTAMLMTWIPKERLAKMSSRMLGKKVPLAGTLIVGSLDVIDIGRGLFIEHKVEATAWMNLGSTIVGLVPGWGTGASAAIDLAVLVATIVENFREFMGIPDAKLGFTKDQVLHLFTA